MNWKLTDELFASFSRPFSMYVCSAAIAVACFGSNAAIALPIAGALAGGQAWLRTADKGIAAKAASEDKRTAAGVATVDSASDVQTKAIVTGSTKPPEGS